MNKLRRRLCQFVRYDAPIHVAAGGLMASAFGLASAPVIARALGPAGRGEAAAVIAATWIASFVLALGVPLEIRRLAALGDVEKSVRAARDLWALAVVPAIVVALVAFSTVFSGMSPLDRAVGIVCLASAPLVMSWMTDTSVLVAAARYRAVMLLRVAQPIFLLVGIALLSCFTRLTLAHVLAAQTASNVLSAALGFYLVGVSMRGERSGRRILLREGFRYSGSGIAEAASNKLDQVLVLPLIGATQAGLYSAAATLAAIPITLAHAIGSNYYRAIANAAPEDWRRIAYEAVKRASAIGALSCGLLAAMSPALIPFIFGKEFAGAVPAAAIALFGAYFMVVAFVGTLALAARAKGLVMTVGQVLSLLVGLVGLVALGPSMGASGAALASAISYVSLLGYVLVQLRVLPSALIVTPRGVLASVRELASRS